jgi:predicted O-methyltransferase YrrM
MDKILFPIQYDYINSFRKEPDELIAEMEKYAREFNIPILSWQSADFLEQLIRILKPKRVLEIGTAIAYSSIRIARNLRKKGIVHTIEKSPENVEKAKVFLAKSGVADRVKIFEGEATVIMSELDKKYNLIFLDADKNDYPKLFDNSMKLLKKGGVIFVANLLWHGYAAEEKIPPKMVNSSNHIKAFNKMFMNHPKLKTTLLPVGDGIGLGIKLKE